MLGSKGSCSMGGLDHRNLDNFLADSVHGAAGASVDLAVTDVDRCRQVEGSECCCRCLEARYSGSDSRPACNVSGKLLLQRT